MPKRVRTTRRLEVWLKDTDVALFVLNAQRRLVFFNHGCERLTGWIASDVLGQKCDYVSESESQTTAALLASLAPPPDAWIGTPTLAPVNVPHREGSPCARIVHYYPLTDRDHQVKAMLGVMVQVTESTDPLAVPTVQRLHSELTSLRQSIRRRYGPGAMIGRTPAMQRVFGQIRLAQSAPSPVLFVGEPGTGKHHLARILHYQSPHGKRAFVPLDCRRAAGEDLGQTLVRLRSEPQSDSLRTGAVYLEHIDAAPSDFQRALADWLKTSDQESNPIRVIASTTRSSAQLATSENFLADLYFALTTIVIEIPPLRDRMDDLEPLAQHLIEESNRDASSQIGGFTDDVWRQFRRYNWPGNVAELQRVIVESRADATNPNLGSEQLPFRFRTGVTAQSMEPAQRPKMVPLDQRLEQVEREQIEQALQICRGNKARAAEILGITRPRLYRRMEVLGITDSEPSSEPPDPQRPMDPPPEFPASS